MVRYNFDHVISVSGDHLCETPALLLQEALTRVFFILLCFLLVAEGLADGLISTVTFLSIILTLLFPSKGVATFFSFWPQKHAGWGHCNFSLKSASIILSVGQ